MIKHVAILCQFHYQYKWLIRHKLPFNKNIEYHFIRSGEDVRGRKFDEYILYDGWNEVKDIFRILERFQVTGTKELKLKDCIPNIPY